MSEILYIVDEDDSMIYYGDLNEFFHEKITTKINHLKYKDLNLELFLNIKTFLDIENDNEFFYSVLSNILQFVENLRL
jgi:hypothetical protein